MKRRIGIRNWVKSGAGFTLVELLISIGIASLLLGLTTINLLNVQHNTSLTAALEKLNADMKSQQIKAMNGAGGGGSFGVHLASNTYILFRGASYNPNDTTNSPVSLDSNILLSSTFSGDTIVFDQRTGEVCPLTCANTITVRNTSGLEQKTITLNRYGITTDIH